MKMISIRCEASFVIAVFLCLSACSPEKETGTSTEVQALETDYENINSQLTELSEEKAQLEEAIKSNEALLKSLDQDVEREAALEAAVLPVSNYLAALESATATVKADIETWRQATRDSYVGMTIPKLQTTSGSIHPNVTITEIRDELFVVEDPDGNKIELPFADVNEAIRKALVHEPTVLSN